MTIAAATRRAYTPPQIAELLGVDPDRVRAWCRAGTLRAVDLSEKPGVGRPRFRVMPEALDEFLATRAVASTPRRKRRRGAAIPRYF